MRTITSFPSWVWPALLVLSLIITCGGIYVSVNQLRGIVVKTFSTNIDTSVTPILFDRLRFIQIAPSLGCIVTDSDVTCSL